MVGRRCPHPVGRASVLHSERSAHRDGGGHTTGRPCQSDDPLPLELVSNQAMATTAPATIASMATSSTDIVFVDSPGAPAATGQHVGHRYHDGGDDPDQNEEVHGYHVGDLSRLRPRCRH